MTTQKSKALTETIGHLRSRANEVQKELTKLSNAIKALQATCPHDDMQYDGHDSHDTYYKCTVCGYVDDR